LGRMGKNKHKILKTKAKTRKYNTFLGIWRFKEREPMNNITNKAMPLIVLSLSGFIGGMISGCANKQVTDAHANNNKKVEFIENLKVKKLSLVDDSGTIRAKLEIDKENGTNFIICDENGNERVKIEAYKGFCGISFFDKNNTPRGGLLFRNEWSLLTLHDKNEKLRTMLGSKGDYATTLSLYDKDGLIATAGSGEDGEIISGIMKGKVRIIQRILKGRNTQAFTDESGKTRLVFTLGPNGEPLQMLLDKKGNRRIAMALGMEGKGLLEFYDKNKNVTWRPGKND